MSHTAMFKEQEEKNVKAAVKKMKASNNEKSTLGDLDVLAELKKKMDSE
jgi:small subunit ribosomal protein S1